jgi:dipeptidyl aminopeptidase/acylaminoacyl peptidase
MEVRRLILKQKLKHTKYLLLLLILVFTSLQADTPKKIPLKDFFKNPVIGSYQISPDAKNMAFTAPYKKRMNIFVQSLELPTGDNKKIKLGRKKRLSTVTDRDISGYFWKGNQTIIYARDFDGDENYNLFAIDIKSKETKALTPFKDVRVGILDDLEDLSDDEILITMNKRKKEIFDVHRLNIRTGEIKLEVQNPGNITGWQTDHDGKVRIAISTDGVNTSLFHRKDDKEDFQKIMTTDFKTSFSPVFFSFDNKDLFAISNVKRDKACAIKYNLAKKKELKTIYCNPNVDVAGLHYSKKRKVLISSTYYTWKLERTFFDEDMMKIFTELQTRLPNMEIGLVSKDKEENTFIVKTESDRNRGVFYIYDSSKKILKKLAEISPWLKEEDLNHMKPIEYRSRDGLLIHGYLTLPKDSSGKKLPVVVNPHGGPWARDDWGFNPLVQFLANRGYAVFQMNFRGSTGYGKKFWEASFKQWGLKMQDDVTDGVNWLIKQGIADPKRIAIYGGSYGGYKVLAGLAFTPELYACGVDYVGVSNLFTFLNTIPPYWKPYLETMYEMVGHPEKDKALLKKTSPVFHVDKIKAPLMVLQGAKDPRVNINESDQIVEALRKRGVNVKYIVKENEGHGFRNEENRMLLYTELEKFLNMCLKK